MSGADAEGVEVQRGLLYPPVEISPLEVLVVAQPLELAVEEPATPAGDDQGQKSEPASTGGGFPIPESEPGAVEDVVGSCPGSGSPTALISSSQVEQITRPFRSTALPASKSDSGTDSSHRLQN
jgi:hypothetical protein